MFPRGPTKYARYRYEPPSAVRPIRHKIGMLNTQRQAVLRAQVTYKGLVAIGCLPAQMMVYMQHVQSLARNGSDAAPVLDIQL